MSYHLQSYRFSAYWVLLRVVKNLLKPNHGRAFFACSEQSNPCSFSAWGDVQHVAKPKCRHGFPCVIRKVKKETVNKDRLFFCCAQEDSCNYFEWVPEEIKQNDKREEQYPAENFINDLAKLKSYFWTSIYRNLKTFEQF